MYQHFQWKLKIVETDCLGLHGLICSCRQNRNIHIGRNAEKPKQWDRKETCEGAWVAARMETRRARCSQTDTFLPDEKKEKQGYRKVRVNKRGGIRGMLGGLGGGRRGRGLCRCGFSHPSICPLRLLGCLRVCQRLCQHLERFRQDKLRWDLTLLRRTQQQGGIITRRILPHLIKTNCIF